MRHCFCTPKFIRWLTRSEHNLSTRLHCIGDLGYGSEGSAIGAGRGALQAFGNSARHHLHFIEIIPGGGVMLQSTAIALHQWHCVKSWLEYVESRFSEDCKD